MFDIHSDLCSLWVNHNHNQNDVLASNSKKHCSAHINKHHTPSMLEVGCRQLRRIDWAGRPICIFLFAFRPLGSSGHKPVLGGARAKRGYPLRGLRCEESATIHLLCCYRTIGLDARPTQRVAALCLAPRCSTSQTLPCAWAHFHSLTLAQTSSAPTAFRYRKMWLCWTHNPQLTGSPLALFSCVLILIASKFALKMLGNIFHIQQNMIRVT